MDDVVFHDEGSRIKAIPQKKEFSLVGFLIEKKLADNEQQALLWVLVILILLVLICFYFMSKTGVLSVVGISPEPEVIPQMSPDRFETNYPGSVEIR